MQDAGTAEKFATGGPPFPSSPIPGSEAGIPAGGSPWQFKFRFPEKPGRKLKRRYLRCHTCYSTSVYYSLKRATCLCENCLKAFDPLVIARRNQIDLDYLCRAIILRGAF